MSFEKYKRMVNCVDWLCAASSKSPRPIRGNGTRHLRTYLHGREICDEANFYLRSCVPSVNLDFFWTANIFGVDGIDFLSGERGIEHFKHGFLAIGDYENKGLVSLLDLKNGFVYLQDFGWYFGSKRMEEIDADSSKPDQILIEQSRRFFVNLESFLEETIVDVEAGLVESLWEPVLAVSGPAPGEYFLPEEEWASHLDEYLHTPVDATLLRDERGMTLLEVAKERNKPLLAALLETYWCDPVRYREASETI